MTTFQGGEALEAQIAQWRAFLRRRQAIHGSDVEELEAHLRDQVAALVEAGLADDEAFLVAVKRMGSLDAMSREFAREHSERLWKQLVVAPDDPGDADAMGRIEGFVVLGLAVAAGIAIKLPALFGQPFVVDDEPNVFYPRNATFFVLPLLVGYFAWKRAFRLPRAAWLAVPFATAAVVANVYPFTGRSDTGLLMILHLPIALWLVVGVAYVGGRWWAGSGRINFVRFSGELFIYYVLIAMGGGVLIGFTLMMFAAIDVDAEWQRGIDHPPLLLLGRQVRSPLPGDAVVLPAPARFRRAPPGAHVAEALQAVQHGIQHAVGPLQVAARQFAHALEDRVAVAVPVSQDGQYQRRGRRRDEILADIHPLQTYTFWFYVSQQCPSRTTTTAAATFSDATIWAPGPPEERDPDRRPPRFLASMPAAAGPARAHLGLAHAGNVTPASSISSQVRVSGSVPRRRAATLSQRRATSGWPVSAFTARATRPERRPAAPTDWRQSGWSNVIGMTSCGRPLASPCAAVPIPP